ncbi:GTP binding protein [Coemansia sp. RSA 2399]|nr:GTP binding protein [Coemansia sp. RSA 2399]KAJ1906314.1 GTP binding protein [Coemansia sp. IMI 209127]
MTTRDTMYTEDIANAGNLKEYCSPLDETVSQLPPEMDRSGNVEYKTKLEAVTDSRTTHLATQLQWRLAEGNGHAVYMIGVRDDGFLVGITEPELEATISAIQNMALQLANVAIVSISKRVLAHRGDRVVAEVHIDQHSNTPRTEVRVAVLGELGVGKSTVLGCLTYGEADDGHGKARLNLLRHRHEVESGRTSSIALGVIGFNADGHVLNYANNRSAEQIYQRSHHVVTLIDTCGYAKHLKTTARAITGHSPHAFCVTIAADRGLVTPTTREYMRIAAVLRMPLMIVLTKMDIAAKSTFAALMHDILATLDVTVPGRGRCIVTDTTESKQLAEDMMRLVVVPIFTTSAVRTLGFSELTSVMSKTLQAPTCANPDAAASPMFEFHVEHTYSIDNVGTVVTGWVNQGSVNISATSVDKRRLCIGPDSTGGFVDIEVNSIHTLRIPTELAETGTSAALAIETHEPVSIEKGMVILDTEYLNKHGRKQVSGEFTARIAILSQEFRSMQSVIVHIRSAYRLAHVLDIADDVGTFGHSQQQSGLDRDFAVVRLRFDDNVCDYLSSGLAIVARDGQNLVFAGHVADVLQ